MKKKYITRLVDRNTKHVRLRFIEDIQKERIKHKKN
jgi:hypothetical protein